MLLAGPNSGDIALHPSYDTSDLPARGFPAASGCCWSDELYVGYTLN